MIDSRGISLAVSCFVSSDFHCLLRHPVSHSIELGGLKASWKNQWDQRGRLGAIFLVSGSKLLLHHGLLRGYSTGHAEYHHRVGATGQPVGAQQPVCHRTQQKGQIHGMTQIPVHSMGHELVICLGFNVTAPAFAQMPVGEKHERKAAYRSQYSQSRGLGGIGIGNLQAVPGRPNMQTG